MKELLLKIKNSKAVGIIQNVLSWKFFPFVTAVIIVGLYYLNLDLLSIYFIALTGLVSVLLLDDLTPLFSNFLFMCIMVSYDHSPSITAGLSSYYLQPAVISQIVVLITLYALGVVARIAITALEGKLKLSPVFYGLAAFAFFLLINGAGSENYNPMNMAYGFFLAFLFLAIFVVMKDNVACTKKSFEYIAYSFFALSLALCFELAIKYLSIDHSVISVNIDRLVLSFGWGMYNTMGMLMVLCVPSVFFLAGISKHGYLYYIYALILAVAIVLTMSRQAMIGVAFVYPICIVILLVKGKNLLANGIITAVAVVIGSVFLGLYWEKVESILELLTSNIDTGNGRLGLWEDAIQNFLSAPVFGAGFYKDLANDPGFPGLKIIPDMYHNTFFQLLGSCGFTGLMAYLVHRVQTVTSFVKNPSIERTFIAITVLALLLLNLLDNHLFYLLPTLIYSALTSVMIKSQNNKSLYPVSAK